ncbi:MAG TPA: hypothetical protein VFF60_06535 [Candidatus Binatus sp.]|nr:hypothetical protein [Candidatus Binatus sp.]
MSGDQIGMIIGAAFGCAWGIAGAVTLRSPWRETLVIVSFAISFLLIRATLSATLPYSHFNGAPYGIAVGLEAVAIAIAAITLNGTGNASFVPPVVAAIVGLHFIGLWLATGKIVFLGTCIAMCVVALAGFFSPASARLPVTGLGSALALWASVAVALRG